MGLETYKQNLDRFILILFVGAMYIMLSMALVGCTPQGSPESKNAEKPAQKVYPRGRTALHESVSLEDVRSLIEGGADVNAPDRFKWTPLHTARTGAIVDFLVAKGANVHMLAAKKKTPLHTAVNGEVAAALIRHGADSNASPEHFPHQTPLYYAAMQGRADTIRALLESGADPMRQNRQGATALHIAAKYGKPAAIEALLARGINANIQTKLQATPLHFAVLHDKPAAAEALLNGGASVWMRLSEHAAVSTYRYGGGPMGSSSQTRSAGEATPLGLAKSEAMKALLRKYGATE